MYQRGTISLVSIGPVGQAQDLPEALLGIVISSSCGWACSTLSILLQGAVKITQSFQRAPTMVGKVSEMVHSKSGSSQIQFEACCPTMITLTGLGESLACTDDDCYTSPVDMAQEIFNDDIPTLGTLRRRKPHPSDWGATLASLSSPQERIPARYLESVPSRLSLDSSSTSCCSSDDDLSEDDPMLSDARTLLGFPYPLLFCLILSSILLPLQVLWCNSSTDHGGNFYRSLQQQKYRTPVHQPVTGSLGSFNQWRKKEYDASTTDEPPRNVIDAVVLIAIGPAATQPAIGWSVHSAVEVGGWHGNVYIITDNPKAVNRTLFPPDETPAPNSLQPENVHFLPPKHVHLLHTKLPSFSAKLTKCSILQILPNELKNVLYIDSDIITGLPLASFWKSVAQIWNESDETELGLFEDGKAFTAGFCHKCDTWNTGVMSIRRGVSDSCLDTWCDKLALHGESDQAVLDRVIAETDQCQNIKVISRQDMRMMKDIFVVLGFVGTKTFNHFTGIFRSQSLNVVHRSFYERMLGRKLNLVPQVPIGSKATCASKWLRGGVRKHFAL